MSGLVKDNVGYDLAGLLTGSEGTLAVITQALLRLVPRYDERAVALIGVDDAASAVEWVGALRRRTDLLDAAELMFADGIDLVCRTTGLAQPLQPAPPAYLLVEIAGPGADEHQLAELIDAAGEPHDAVLAGDATGRAGLWRYREAHPEAVGTQGIELKLDVAVHVHRLAELVSSIRDITNPLADAATYLYGHLAEGSVHINVVGPSVERPGAAEELTGVLLSAVAALGGSISAEHGVGRAKRAWVHLSRDPADEAAMRAVKAALDPAALLNPGVLLP
jgi:FAD/FMN-containing dehydrogenase